MGLGTTAPPSRCRAPRRRALLAILLLHASEVVPRATAEPVAGRRAYVPFAGHEHDWAAPELGA